MKLIFIMHPLKSLHVGGYRTSCYELVHGDRLFNLINVLLNHRTGDQFVFCSPIKEALSKEDRWASP